MEIVFYDIETTIPSTDIIEFGAIVLDKAGLYENDSYSTLIQSNKISDWSIDCNGITMEMVKDAPTFEDVADNIFNILHNRIWAGHNITRFDNPLIIKHFKKIGRKPPEPIGIIDTLPLLQKTFGPRGGNLKMETLGNYFGLGKERHRAIADCQMTIEVLKKCSMTLFLEEYFGYNSLAPQRKSVTTDERDSVFHAIDKAIEKEQSVWISYKGGSTPLVPRQIKPIRWDSKNDKLSAFCHQSQSIKYFFQSKIVEIREECWEI
ncbi:MAG: exonuclease domain-containing protein [Dissulfuribacterales bacterium]